MTDEPKMQPEVKMQAEVQSDVRKIRGVLLSSCAALLRT